MSRADRQTASYAKLQNQYIISSYSYVVFGKRHLWNVFHIEKIVTGMSHACFSIESKLQEQSKMIAEYSEPLLTPLLFHSINLSRSSSYSVFSLSTLLSVKSFSLSSLKHKQVKSTQLNSSQSINQSQYGCRWRKRESCKYDYMYGMVEQKQWIERTIKVARTRSKWSMTDTALLLLLLYFHAVRSLLSLSLYLLRVSITSWTYTQDTTTARRLRGSQM